MIRSTNRGDVTDRMTLPKDRRISFAVKWVSADFVVI